MIDQNWKRLLDVILALPTVPAALLLRFVRAKRITNFPICRSILRRIGVFPVIDHYYEPLIDPGKLRHPLSNERSLPGIDWNEGEQIELLRQLRFGSELAGIERQNPSHEHFSFNNTTFLSGDAEYWYSLIRHKKPRRIIEIGSGNSTLLAKLAIQKNKATTSGYVCEHLCIEPYEFPLLEKLDLQVLRKRVEEIEVGFFRSLSENDILFIDSSHVIRPQGDVLFELLELLPTLNRGVIVHLHDIFSPRDYPEDWIRRDMRFWNEQYLLEAFLTNNREWKIIGALNFLHHRHYEELNRVCVNLTTDREPGSFYIQKL
jgi:hypothetical protein